MKKKHLHLFKRTQISLAILSILASPQVIANPSGAQVISGQINVDTSIPGTLNITNTPGAIINWQNFSIAQGEITRFIQQNSQSTILNRVIGGNPSQIMGHLISNGQVMLINSNGIVFGANSMVNTNGFIASTLAMSDQDFLTGNYHFIAGSQAGNVFNEGIIRTGEDGNIVLIAPDIKNNGVIETDGGKIVLAAGQELTITSLDNPQIRYQVQAPDNEVLNLGHILSNGGAIDLFAGTLTHSGEISSESLTLDASGNITFKSQADITLTSTSKTTANSVISSGDVIVQSTAGTTLIEGEITSTSQNDSGGKILLLGERVGIMGESLIDASGQSGGEILIGGDYRGENAEIQNATATYVAEEASIKANADQNGDGGKIIVWADESTQMYGTIESKGGAESGNGGFVETSGYFLDVGQHAPDVSASEGSGGTWLLDPHNISIETTVGNLLSPFTAILDDSVITNTVLNTTLNLGGTVILDTGSTGSQAGDITINADITKTSGIASTLQLNASNAITVNADITSTSNALNLSFNSGSDEIFLTGTTINLNGGTFSTSSSATIEATSTNTLSSQTLNVDNLTLTSGTLTLDTGNLISVYNLDVNGGTLEGSDNLYIYNTFDWTNGSINGTGSFSTDFYATSTLSGNTLYFRNGTWNNDGVINWTGNAGGADNFYMFTSTLNNTGSFNDNTSASSYAIFGWSNDATINNSGTWNKSGATPYSTNSSAAFNNTGTVNVNYNELRLRSGADTGTYNISSNNNGLLNFASGTHTFSNTSSISGLGELNISGGMTATFDSGATINVGQLVISGGTANFNNANTITLGSYQHTGGTANYASGNILSITDEILTVSGGTINLNTANTNPLQLSTLNFSGGTISGSDDITVVNAFNWSAGTISSSGTFTTFGGDGYATATLSGQSLTFSNGTWVNDGIINWVGNSGSNDTFYLNNATLNNNYLFNDNTTATNYVYFGYYGNSTINNYGDWNKEGTSPYSYNVSNIFNNLGTVNVNYNEFRLTGGGSDTGTYNVATSNNALLSFSGGTRTLSSTSSTNGLVTFTGGTTTFENGSSYNLTGALNISGGTVYFNGGDNSIDVDSYTQTNGNVTFGLFNTLNIADSTLTLSRGTLTFNTSDNLSFDTLVMGDIGTATLTGSDSITINDAFTWNVGTISTTGTLTTDSGTITNINGGNVYVTNTTWNNNGTINWNGNAGSNDTILMNTATLNNAGTFNDNTSATSYAYFGYYGSSTINNSGTWNKNGTTPYSYTQSSIFNNTGTVNVNFNEFRLTSGGTDSGTYNVGSTNNALLSFSGGTRILTGTSSISGTTRFTAGTTTFDAGSNYAFSGALTVSGGTVNLNGSNTLNLASYTQTNGIMNVGAGNSLILADSTLTLSRGTLNLNSGSNLSVDTFVLGALGNATLTGSDNVIVNDNFTWSNGTISTSGLFTTDTGSTTTITDGNLTFNTGTWQNNGTVNWNGDAGTTDTFIMNGGTLNNAGTFNDNTNATSYAYFGYYGSGTINNSGTWNKAGTTPYSYTQSTIFNNTGIVNVNFNELRLTAGGTDTGSYNVSSSNNALLTFGGGIRTIGGTGSVSGQARFTGGSTTFNDTSSYSNAGDVTIQNATLNTNTTNTLSFDSLTLSNSVTLGGTGAIAVGTLSLSSGTLGGTGTINVTDAFNWSGGYLTNTDFNTASGSTSTLSGNAHYLWTNGIWNNSGTVNFDGNGSANEYFFIYNGATFNNAGTFNDNSGATSYAVIGNYSNGIVNNSGTWNKTGTAAITYSNLGSFNNTGILNVNANDFRVSANGNDTGTYNVASNNNALLTFSGGTRTFSGSATNSGPIRFTGGTTTFDTTADLTFNTGSVSIEGGTFTNNSSNTLTFDTFSLSNGTVNGTGTINVTNAFNWTGGYLQSTDFNTASGSTSTLSGNAHYLWTNGIWNNSGTVNFDGNGSANEYFFIYNGATFNNAGTFNDNSGATSYAVIGNYSNGIVNNSGTWNKTGTAAITYSNLGSFNNTGIVNVTNGTYDINASGTSPGSFDVASGTVLNLSGSSITLDHPKDFTGLGEVYFGSGISFNGTQSGYINQSTTFDIDSGPLNLISLNSTNITNGSLVNNNNGTLTYTPNTDFSGTADSFTFVIADSSMNTSVNGTITLNINNQLFTWAGPTTGTASWNDPSFWGGTVPTDGSDVTIPFVSGSLTIQYNSGSLFLNSLTSNESIDISGGILTLGDATTDTSSFASGTNLNLSGGTFGGGGTIDILGGINWTGGTLSGSGNLDLTSATSINMSGTLTQAGMSVTVPAGVLASGTTYNLSGGSFNTSNTTHNSGAIMNISGGTFNATGNANINGTLNWSSGAINIGGSVTIGSTGIISISGDSSTSVSGITNNGTLKKTGGTGTSTINTTSFTNNGTVHAQSGTLNLGNNYVQASGATTLNGGNIQATNTTLNGGVLNGSGTVLGNLNNNAIVAPGFSPGTITISGNYLQGSTGTLTMEIAGTAAGSYDQLLVGGTASLDGTLNITPISPYTILGQAQVGDSYDFIISDTAITGNFASIIPLTGYLFSPTLTATTYSFTVDQVAATTAPQPLVNAVVTVQTTDVLTLTDQAILDPTLELTPETQPEEPTEEIEQPEDPTVETTVATNEEVEGTLMICY